MLGETVTCSGAMHAGLGRVRRFFPIREALHGNVCWLFNMVSIFEAVPRRLPQILIPNLVDLCDPEAKLSEVRPYGPFQRHVFVCSAG